MKNTLVLTFSALVFGSVAHAALGALPSNLAIEDVTIAVPKSGVGYPGRLGYAAGGGGGAFDGTVQFGNNTPAETAFWCIDDQTYFYDNNPRTQNANITKLSDYNTLLGEAGGPGELAFGGTSASDWYNKNLPGPSGAAFTSTWDTQVGRLELAAYLVSKYDGFSPYTTINGGAAAAKNDAIQYAIWALTNNAAFNSHTPGSGFNGSGTYTGAFNTSDDTDYRTWIYRAYTAATTTGSDFTTLANPDNWAVVSWVIGANDQYNGPQQTFLVELGAPNNQVTPEPGFYGVLALGLSGLALTISRKRKSA